MVQRSRSRFGQDSLLVARDAIMRTGIQKKIQTAIIMDRKTWMHL